MSNYPSSGLTYINEFRLSQLLNKHAKYSLVVILDTFNNFYLEKVEKTFISSNFSKRILVRPACVFFYPKYACVIG